MSNLFFAVLAVFVMASCGETTTENSKEDKNKGEQENSSNSGEKAGWLDIGNSLFSIKYPSEWTRNMEVTPGVHFALISPLEGKDDDYTENIYLVVKELFDPSVNKNEDFGVSLDLIANDLTNQINTILPGGKVLRSERKEMNGLEFHELQYMGSDATYETIMLNRIWLDKGRSYALNYTGTQSGGYKSNEDAATKIMDSFVIK